MTDISLSPHGAAAAKAQSNSIFRHARYVVAENPVTGVAFGLFILIALCALIGPYVVPYDPLASDT
ncbi:MAG: ABC transporter permease, partial [Pseudolabrys sp.]